MASNAQTLWALPRSSDPARVFVAGEDDVYRFRPGGLHLVSLGEVSESSRARYKIIHKLGWGSYSVVWLASVLDWQDKPLR